MNPSKTILLADADPLFLAEYADLLRSPYMLGAHQWPGLPVHAIDTHALLWATLERERPAIVILDITLPDGNSREFMQRIRASAEYRETPVIMTYPDEAIEDEQAFYDMTLGIDARLMKPIGQSEIVGFLHRILQAVDADPNDNSL